MTSPLKKDGVAEERLDEIRAILAMTRTSRDNALDLGLKFEAYLLDMACVALAETLSNQS